MASDCGLHKLIADVTLLHGDRVLLVRYRDTNRYDHQRGWFLPDDALRHQEEPEHGATRILAEQLGVEVRGLRLGFVESFRGRDRTWHVIFHFVAVLPAASELLPSADIAAASWFALDALPARGEIAHHGWALDILERLTGRAPGEEAEPAERLAS